MITDDSLFYWVERQSELLCSVFSILSLFGLDGWLIHTHKYGNFKANGFYSELDSFKKIGNRKDACKG